MKFRILIPIYLIFTIGLVIIGLQSKSPTIRVLACGNIIIYAYVITTNLKEFIKRYQYK